MFFRLVNLFGKVLMSIPFLLLLFTVFIIGKELSNGVISGKYFWFYGCMGLITVVVFILSAFYKKNRFSLLDLGVLVFAGSVYFSALVINDASQNTTKLTILALLVILYFYIRLFLLNDFYKKTFNRNFLYFFIIVTGFVEAVWGLLQLYSFEHSQHSLFKITGSFFNPGPYSGYLAVIFPLALYFWLNVKENDNHTLYKLFSLLIKWFSSIVCLVIILILPTGMSRASWLALAGGSFVVLSFYLFEHYPIKEYYHQHKRKIKIEVFISIVLLLICFFGMYQMKKDSADGRTLMWRVSLQVIKEHPFGVGLGNFSGAYGKAQAEYLASDRASETDRYVAGNPEYAFNEYLQILVESGIFTFLLFTGIIITAFRSLYRQKQWGIMGGLTALLIFSCFSYPFSVLPFLILLIIFLAMSNSLQKINGKTKNILIGIVGLLITSFCLYKQYPVYQAYRKWNREQIYYQAGLYKDVSKIYEAMYPYLNDQIKFLFEYAQSLSKAGQYAQSNRVLQRAMEISCDPVLYNVAGKNAQALKKYEQAEQYLIQSTKIVPNRLYPYYLLTLLYDEMGETAKACEMAKIVLTKEPKVSSEAVKEMREKVKCFLLQTYDNQCIEVKK
jgi:O-antigen ligase